MRERKFVEEAIGSNLFSEPNMVRFLSDSANDPSVIVDTISSSEPSRASENLSQIDKS